MKYYINQKFFTFVHEQYNIIDENQTPHFAVQGQALWKGKRLSVFDMHQNLLFKLNRRLFRILTTIDILNAQDEVLANFKQKLHFGVKKIYGVITAKGAEYSITENWLGTEYSVNRLQTGEAADENGNVKQEKSEVPVALVNKKLIEFSDRYQVEILDESETIMSLATILCVDMARQKRENDESSD